MKITGQMIVKNEDQWVWFAITSVLPFVDRLHIIDTGSTDRTVACIQSIASPKIVFETSKADSPSEVTHLRQYQLEQTTTPWLWLIDGDEVYTEEGAKEIRRAVTRGNYTAVVVRRYDLLGDVYHRQSEAVGSYNLFGETGHLVTRLLNKDVLRGLSVRGEYPYEGYYDGEGKSVRALPRDAVYISDHALFHAMYLKRSSRGRTLPSMLNRSKYKIEKGEVITTPLPAVFREKRLSFVPDPVAKRGFAYECAAAVVTPLKKIKRSLL